VITKQLLAAFPYLATDLDRLRDRMAGTRQVQGWPDLTEIVGHLLDGVPKLVRPGLALMSAYIAGDPHRPVPDHVIEAAVAAEHIHVGTLCHDDVMDEAATRRARQSVNAGWGNSMAILSGDYHLGTAAVVGARLGRATSAIIAELFQTLCRGQMIETVDRYNVNRSEESYIESISGKTAMLLSSSCRLGALHASADADVVDALARFGIEFGIAFQINDDVLDLTRSEAELGKPPGNDIFEGVYTLPVLRAIRGSTELHDLLSPPVTRTGATRAIELVVASGAIEEAAALGRSWFESAIRSLPSLPGREQQIEALIAFARDLLMTLPYPVASA
jgi:geranylgeranyl pyrophosphate synthase